VSVGRLKAGLQPGSILIPTGGTTGGVKLAIHNWSSLCAASAGLQAFLGGGPIHSCCVLPLYHVSGLMQLVRSLVTGGRVRFDDGELSGYCLSLVPTQLQRALQDPERACKLGAASVIFVGGAPMPEELAERARYLKLPIVPVYGMTETAAMCAAIPQQDFLTNPEAGAVPIGDTRFRIEAGGRIRIQSGALFSGYQGHPPIDRNHGYLSGDVGHLDADGRLYVEGRADRVIISGGEKIDPQEVEHAIGQLAGIDSVLAVGLPDPEWGQKLVAFYTGVEIEDWKSQLEANLAHYKIPKRMIRVDELPLDAKGKLNKTVGASLVKTAEDSASGTL
jgi:O-succinylbenzoic acid--CoA ligase